MEELKLLLLHIEINRNSFLQAASGLNRRSTLASARDRNGDVNHPGAIGATHAAKLTAATSDGDNMGSLPNLAELETQGVRYTFWLEIKPEIERNVGK